MNNNTPKSSLNTFSIFLVILFLCALTLEGCDIESDEFFRRDVNVASQTDVDDDDDEDPDATETATATETASASATATDEATEIPTETATATASVTPEETPTTESLSLTRAFRDIEETTNNNRDLELSDELGKIGQDDNDETSYQGADTDGDGFSDLLERSAGTNEASASDQPVIGLSLSILSQSKAIINDTDRDGIADKDDSAPNNSDINGNNILDGIELAAGGNPTDPQSSYKDSDGDGLPDSLEKENGSDPSKADTDNDGLLDGAEYIAATNALSADTDGDGISDGTEVKYKLDPLTFDRLPKKDTE